MLSRMLKLFSTTYGKIRTYVYTFLVKRKVKEVGENFRVNSKSFVAGEVVLGNNVNFNGMTILGYGQTKIGNNFHSGPECMIITSIHNYDNGVTIPYDSTNICKDVIIENNVWLGARVTILGKSRIGEGAIIQAGSVVIGDIPKYAIAGGNPASVFKYRDIEHYERLKKEKCFY